VLDEYAVRYGVFAEEADASLDDCLVFFWRALHPIVRRELWQIRTRDDDSEMTAAVVSSVSSKAKSLDVGFCAAVTGLRLYRCIIRGRTDGGIRLRAENFKNRLHLTGRPQMSTRPGILGLEHLLDRLEYVLCTPFDVTVGPSLERLSVN